jgi:hypothetical protein
MFDAGNIGLLVLVGLVLLLTGLLHYRTLKKDEAVVKKYRLYQIRDDFVGLVAEGKLSEDDFLFQTFYQAINRLIDETTDHLTLENFSRSD